MFTYKLNFDGSRDSYGSASGWVIHDINDVIKVAFTFLELFLFWWLNIQPCGI